MKFKYIGPHDEVSLDAVGVTVKRGEVVNVPASVAGAAATSPEKPVDGARDLGHGLLAQPDVWEPVTTTNNKSARGAVKES